MKILFTALVVICLFSSGCQNKLNDSVSSLDSELAGVPATANNAGPGQPQRGFDQEVDQALKA